MKPLIVLICVFAISALAFKIFRGNFEWMLSGRIAMSVMLVFTAVSHFVFTKGMAMMLPEFIPFKIQVIYLTGLIELAGALGLFFPAYRVLTAWLLIVFFVFILPANIHAAVIHVNIEKGTFDGNGLAYLWFRVPLQVLFIVWIYLSTIKNY